MKNIIKTAFACIATLALASCYSDDSNIGGNYVGEIEISPLEESYTCMAYADEHLKINPDIKLGYDESQMKYTWMLLNNRTGSTTENGDTIQPVVIGTEKNLDYVVATAPGQYQLRFVAEAPNGYYQIVYTKVSVQTAFSEGFYVLKETTDGNTDLDLLTAKDATISNIYTAVHGAPLKGKPNTLNLIYTSFYINDDSGEMESTDALAVTTEEGKLSVNRTSDFATTFDNSNICFDPLDPSEKVYSYIWIPGLFYHNVLYSSKGARLSDLTSECTGQFGFIEDYAAVPASRWVICPFNGSTYGSGAFWSDENKTIYGTDYNVDPVAINEASDLAGYSCVGAGACTTGGANVVFILDENGAGRKAYVLSTSMMGSSFKKSMQLPEHMAKGKAYTVCGMQATYIYTVTDNKLWAMNFSADEPNETQFPLQGIGSDEEINFVTNQYNSNSFNYLIIGTQKGNNYKLYMYEMNGGVPQGAPVKTISGEGKVKSVRHLDPTLAGQAFMLKYGYITLSSWD